MAKFHRCNNGIGWLEITRNELVGYSGNTNPICDQCLVKLKDNSHVVLIPLLNEAFCPDCGQAVLKRMKSYPEDKPIAERREKFWLDYFGIKGDRPAAPGTASSKSIYGQSINPNSSCQDGEGLS